MVLLTLLRFSGVAAAELEPECALLLLWAPLVLRTLEEEEEDEEDEEGTGGGGAGAWREDEEWDGRLCDVDDDDDDDGFFFFLTDVGAS